MLRTFRLAASASLRARSLHSSASVSLAAKGEKIIREVDEKKLRRDISEYIRRGNQLSSLETVSRPIPGMTHC